MSIQYSRGCPYDCEFCDIVILNGHKPRTKTKDQVIRELEELYTHGWRGAILLLTITLSAIKRNLKKKYCRQSSVGVKVRDNLRHFSPKRQINLADDEELMRLMVKAGFDRVFIGIETPNEESLVECNKSQNKNRDPL